tara:strand:- start:56 stop:661 length:606 start_codon:yes stop_codon:yes gene_type:complete
MTYRQRQKQRVLELSLLDPPSGLTPQEQRFLQEYATCGVIVDAMRATCAVEDINRPDASLVTSAVTILKKPIAKQYMAKLQDRLEELGVASLLNTQLFLSSAMTTPLEDIDASHPLCQTRTVTTTTNRDGTESKVEKFAMVDKLKATEMLNKMKGWEAPKEVNITANGGGAMMVPLAENLSDWTALAAPSQKALMDDAIDV